MCQAVNRQLLFFLNVFDICVGAAFGILSLYLWHHKCEPGRDGTIIYCSLAGIGAWLVVMGLSSGFGVANKRCQCCLTVSSLMGVVVALAEIVLAIFIFSAMTEISQELPKLANTTASSSFCFDVTQADIQKGASLQEKYLKLHTWVAVALLALAFSQVIRLCSSRSLRRANWEATDRLSERFFDDYDDMENSIQKEGEISSKYDALRSKYRQKHGAR